MTIGRMQMNKQLYGIGSKSLSENGRDRFGLGSFIRKIIPNEISKIAVKAAPFVAPFNPALAAGMAGIGGYDQTGKFGSSLGKAALVYGGGQAARYLGGAGFQDNPFSGDMSNVLNNFTSLTNPMSGGSIFEGFGTPGTPVQNLKDVNPVSQIGQNATAATSSLDSAVGSGGIEDYLAQTDQMSKIPFEQRVDMVGRSLGQGVNSTPYADAANKILSGDPSTMWEGTKSLGKEALNDVFYKTVDGERVLDKPVAFAALSGAYSYYDALQQAKKLGLDENSYTKEMYEADVASNKSKYQANLPYESFGIQTAANGGRIGYASGSEDPKFDPSNPKYKGINKKVVLEFIKEGIPLGYNSPEEYYEDFYNPIGMKNGGRIGYAEGSNLEQSMDEYLKALDAYTKEFGLKEGYSRAQNDYKYLFEKKANGGRIGYAEGSREGIVSLTDQNSGVVYRDPKTGEPLTIDEFLRRAAEDEAEIQLLKEGEEPGSQFISRPDDAPSIRLPEKGIRSLDTGDFENETKNISNSKKLKSKYESDPYVTQLLKRIGTEAFFGGEPNPTSKYREFDKMSPEYQDRVETRREKDRRFFQQPGYGVHTTREIPRYDDYGMEMKANGGRIGYGFGSLVKASGVATPVSEGTVRPLGTVLPSPVNNSRGGFGNMNLFSQMMDRFKQTPANNARGTAVNQLYNYYNDNEYDPEEEKRKKIMELYMRDNAKSGGRMGYMMGTEVPMRQNQGGISELDYRKTGGFVPVGVKEKADDVPAMLSKNEFVFTADAVKAAGGGSVSKGAQKMYKLMKSLEGKFKGKFKGKKIRA
jgi:hypothetical protein